MANVAVCYATGSGILRWVAGNGDGDIDSTKFAAGKGESLLICDHTTITDKDGFFQETLALQQIAQAIGKTPDDPSCAVVENSAVTRMIRADPTLDTLPGAAIVQAYSPSIAIGCTYDQANKVFMTPSVVISSGIGKDGTTIQPSIEPPAVIPNTKSQAAAVGK